MKNVQMINLLMRNLLKKDFVRVEKEGNAMLLKLEKQCSNGLLMYEEYWKDAYPPKCFDQSATKYTMNGYSQNPNLLLKKTN